MKKLVDLMTIQQKEAELVYDSKFIQLFKDIDNNTCPICKERMIKVCKKCGVEAHL